MQVDLGAVRYLTTIATQCRNTRPHYTADSQQQFQCVTSYYLNVAIIAAGADSDFTAMGVGSGRQVTAFAVTWILALDKVDMGMLRFWWHSLQNTLDVNLMLCCVRARNKSINSSDQCTD